MSLSPSISQSIRLSLLLFFVSFLSFSITLYHSPSFSLFFFLFFLSLYLSILISLSSRLFINCPATQPIINLIFVNSPQRLCNQQLWYVMEGWPHPVQDSLRRSWEDQQNSAQKYKRETFWRREGPMQNHKVKHPFEIFRLRVNALEKKFIFI